MLVFSPLRLSSVAAIARYPACSVLLGISGKPRARDDVAPTTGPGW